MIFERRETENEPSSFPRMPVMSLFVQVALASGRFFQSFRFVLTANDVCRGVSNIQPFGRRNII